MSTPQQGVVQRVPVAPSPIAGTFTFPANAAAPTVPIPVMVRHPHTNPARVEVVIGVSRRFRGTGGTLEESGRTVSFRWFNKATGGTAVIIPATGLSLTAAQLNAGFHLFAESNEPSQSVGDYKLTLVLAGGPDPLATPPASVALTAVRLTLDVFPPGPTTGPNQPAPMPEPPATAPPAGTATDKWFLGRTVNVQDVTISQARARIKVRQVEPFDFTGNLSIRQRVLSGNTLGRDSARAGLMDDDNVPPLPGLPPPLHITNPNPFVFPAPGILGRDFFVEGRGLSRAPRDVAFQLGLEGGEPDGDRVAFTVGVAGSIAIDNAVRAVLVKKAPASPARRRVTLKAGVPFTGTGSFDVTTGNTPTRVQFFAAAAGGAALALPITVTGAQLSAPAGFDLFAEGIARSATVGDLTLSLTLSGGANPAGQPATTKITAVELTLDLCAPRLTPRVDPVPLPAAGKSRPGRTIQIREADLSHQRAMLIVRKPSPAIVTDLVVETVGQGGPSRLSIFADETPAAGQVALASPHTLTFLDLDLNPRRFVEGTSVSTGMRDTSLRVGIPGLDPEGDRIDTTVYGDLSVAGPFPVGEKNYTRAVLFTIPTQTETLSDLTVLEVPPALVGPHTHAAFDTPIQGLIRYPATVAGVDQPVSDLLDTYPLVILAHGNHGVFSAGGVRVNSFDGLEYLCRHLASYGYVAASINLDFMNVDLTTVPATLVNRFPTIVQRGLTILEHITELETLNTTDAQLTGRIDLGQVALIGHSRGGEGVVSAQTSNLARAVPRAIRTIVSIAPTDFLGIVEGSVPYLVVYGSADNDVSTGHPFRLYDRATRLKSAVFIEGANHNFFSTNFDWVADPDSTDARLIPAAQHVALARAYCLGWLEMNVRGQHDHLPLFDRNGRPAAVAGPAIFHQFRQADTQRAVVDDYSQGAFDPAAPHGPQLATRAERNTLGGAVAVAGLVTPVGLSNPRTEASLRRRDLANFFHDTFGAMVAWDVAGGNLTTTFGAGDVSGFRVVSFRVAQRFNVPRNPNPAGLGAGAVRDLTVRLTDSSGHNAQVRAGTVATIPFPWKRPAGEGGLARTKSVLRTIRLPLAAFKNANNNLDLTAIFSIGFLFDQSASGELAIDTVEFSD